MRPIRLFALPLTLVALATLVLPSAAGAQTGLASITGIVSDASGAAVLDTISGHLSRRMLDAFLSTSGSTRSGTRSMGWTICGEPDDTANGPNGSQQRGTPKSRTIVEVADDLTSQSRDSLLLQGSPPSGNLLIPLARRDGRSG